MFKWHMVVMIQEKKREMIEKYTNHFIQMSDLVFD